MVLCSFLLPHTFLLQTELTPPAATFFRDILSYISLPLGLKTTRVMKLEYEKTNEWLSYRVSSCRTFREAKEIKKKPAETVS